MNMMAKFWFLEDFDLMKKMGRIKLMQLSATLEMTVIEKGEVLNFNRDNRQVVYFLKTGSVKIVSGHSKKTQSIIKKGNVFGELPLLDGEVDNDQAVVLEDGVICFIEGAKMRELLEEFPTLKNGLLKLSGLKIRRLQRRLEDLLYKDSKTRIKEYILDYLEEFGSVEGDKLRAKNSISHSDIASLTNTSRQTVSNVLSRMRKEGVIFYDSKIIEVNRT